MQALRAVVTVNHAAERLSLAHLAAAKITISIDLSIVNLLEGAGAVERGRSTQAG